jgi:hypothetical protein
VLFWHIHAVLEVLRALCHAIAILQTVTAGLLSAMLVPDNVSKKKKMHTYVLEELPDLVIRLCMVVSRS